MSKFWGFVGILIIVGTGMVLAGNQAPSINFTDFETECRYDRQETTDIGVHTDENRLTFEGHFPINNTDSDLSYTYKVSGGEIILKIVPEPRDQPASFVDECLGLAVYNAETGEIPDGRYRVEVQHDRERVEERVIRFN